MVSSPIQALVDFPLSPVIWTSVATGKTFAPLGMAVLFAATERLEQARPLLDDALRLGGDVARATATGYPALAPLLAESAGVPSS